MGKAEELKQKAKIPNDSILAVVSVLNKAYRDGQIHNDETELKLEKHKRYRFTESELDEYAQQVSIGFSEHLSSIVDTGDELFSFEEEFKEWILTTKTNSNENRK